MDIMMRNIGVTGVAKKMAERLTPEDRKMYAYFILESSLDCKLIQMESMTTSTRCLGIQSNSTFCMRLTPSHGPLRIQFACKS